MFLQTTFLYYTFRRKNFYIVVKFEQIGSTNLKTPKNLARICLKRGVFDYRVSKDDIILYSLKNNKPVYIISNIHSAEPEW